MTIELTDKQARLIAEALEQHSRVLCGQIELSKIKALETALYRDCKYNHEFWKKRDLVEEKLKELKSLIFPELSLSESYGVGKFEEADLGYEMYKMILLHFEDKRRIEEGDAYRSNVHSYSPLKLTLQPLIKIR